MCEMEGNDLSLLVCSLAKLSVSLRNFAFAHKSSVMEKYEIGGKIYFSALASEHNVFLGELNLSGKHNFQKQ